MNKDIPDTGVETQSNDRPARSVTPQQVEDAIVSEHYFQASIGARIAGTETHPLDLLTFCVLVMKNGFTVTGESACADPKKFDRQIGERIARGKAVEKVWGLLGYALRDEMDREEKLLQERAFTDHEGGEVYIGTKVVHARPMNRQDYNDLRGWDLTADENGADEGYLVEYTDRVEDPTHVEGFNGYVSWSPKSVFERAYRKVGA